MERGISLRLGRSSNIHDAEITLLVNPNESRFVKLGRINGMVYDQLYSPASLLRPLDNRNYLADVLAGELRQLINDTHAEISVRFVVAGPSSNLTLFADGKLTGCHQPTR
jgi:hypothetical protein